MDFKKIYEGWKNHLFPPKELKQFLEELSTYRLDICKECDQNTTPGEAKISSRCSTCGCYLIAKSKSLDSSCPIQKWQAVASPEEDEKFQNDIKE